MSNKKILNNLNKIKKSISSESHYKSQLGKGLSAILQNQDIPSNNHKHQVLDIDIDKIIASTYQPRNKFEEEKLLELSESIKNKGVLQPILVRKHGEDKYELIAGERRLRGSKLAGKTKIPAIVIVATNKESLEIGLIENLHRENLNPVEYAKSFAKLISEFGYTHDSISKIIGISRSSISNHLRILNLSDKVQDLIIKNQISFGHAKILISTDDPERLAHRIISDNLTIRQLEDLINKNTNTKRVKKVINSSNSTDILAKQIQLAIHLKQQPTIRLNSNGSGYVKIKFNSIKELNSLIN